MADVYICKHCHFFLTGKGIYCSDCNSAEKRHKMDEENRKLNPLYKCHECDLKQKFYSQRSHQ